MSDFLAAGAAGVTAAVAWRSGKRNLAMLAAASVVLALAWSQMESKPWKEQRKPNGNAKIDSSAGSKPVEEPEDPLFRRAQEFASKGIGGLDNDTKLKLYAYFKQGTVGPCNTPKPPMFEFAASAKWNSWKSLGHMSKGDARLAYIQLVDDLAPNWRTLDDAEVQQLAEELEENEAENNSGSMSMGPRVSTFQMMEEKEEGDMTIEERLFAVTSDGDLSEVIAIIDRLGPAAHQIRGDAGVSILHMACDRGHIELVDFLLANGSVLEARDEEGLTPLVYAGMNGHLNLVLHLIDKHAANWEGSSDEQESFLEIFDPEVAAYIRDQREIEK